MQYIYIYLLIVLRCFSCNLLIHPSHDIGVRPSWWIMDSLLVINNKDCDSVLSHCCPFSSYWLNHVDLIRATCFSLLSLCQGFFVSLGVFTQRGLYGGCGGGTAEEISVYSICIWVKKQKKKRGQRQSLCVCVSVLRLRQLSRWCPTQV